MEKQGRNVLGKLVLIMLVLVMTVSQNAKADEISDLKRQLAEQQQMLLKMQQRLDQLEIQQTEAAKQAPLSPADQKQMELMIAKMFEENKSDFVAPDWVNNIKPFGDFRYRHESIDDTDTGADKRNRNRIRARLGFKAEINDEWNAIFRIATGSSDSPTSTNQTLGDSGSDSFSSKDIWLDWAYADWHPASMPELNVYFGKMKNPFYNVGKNQLIWDGDVSPEGIAARKVIKLNDSTEAVFTGAGYWLAERSGDADASFWGLQGYLKHKFDNGNNLICGLTYYDLGNVDDTTLSGVGLNGNSSNGSGGYMYDFDIIEGFAEYGFKLNEMPLAVFGNYVENTAAPSGRNSGYLIGARLNKAKKPGSWQFTYNYRDLQSDAVFAGLTDSDFILGGTGGRGHKLGYKYQLAKNVQAALTYFIAERDNRSGSGNQDVKLLQADLIFKF